MSHSLRHIYVLVVVIIGWVFFRASTLVEAIDYLKCMFYLSNGQNYVPLLYLTRFNVLILIIGLIYTTPSRNYINSKIFSLLKGKLNINLKYNIKLLIYSFILIFTILELVQGSYNPFIYFRF